jgi:hypothetical protein
LNHEIPSLQDALLHFEERTLIYLDNVLTAEEAAQLYGKSAEAIKNNCRIGKISPNGCRKTIGGSWLVTKDALFHCFGAPKPGAKRGES